jgi:hypothetical protein
MFKYISLKCEKCYHTGNYITRPGEKISCSQCNCVLGNHCNTPHHHVTTDDCVIGSKQHIKNLYVHGDIFRQVSNCRLERVGDVSGPQYSYVNVIPTFQDCLGNKLQNTPATLDPLGNMTIPKSGSLTIGQDDVKAGYVFTSDCNGVGRWADIGTVISDCTNDSSLLSRICALEHKIKEQEETIKLMYKLLEKLNCD